jgi:glycosyltransferase involved in cell wall biosynthesis
MPHLVHVFPAFATGGAQMRTVTVMNRLGDEFRHTVIAMNGDFTARQVVDPALDCRFVPAPPRRGSLRDPWGLRRLIRELAPDLLLTYNWGAMDAFVGGATIPGLPLIHGEDGFGPDEAKRLLRRRVWMRRLWLRRAHRVVVPSRNLLRIARAEYRLREPRAAYIPNGIDSGSFTPGKNPALRRELGIAEEGVVFGFVGRLGGEKNLGLLLGAFAAAGLPGARLLLVGEGECEAALRRQAEGLGLAGRVIFTGPQARPLDFYRAMDVFTMSSLTEQAPISLLEAMACGLPVLCTDVGDMREMLGSPAFPAIVNSEDLAGYTAGLRRMAADQAWRESLGTANRRRCLAAYSLETMIAAYRDLYRGGIAAGRQLSC